MKKSAAIIILLFFSFFYCSKKDTGVNGDQDNTNPLNSKNSPVTVTYVINEGFLISTPDKKVLIDAPILKSLPWVNTDIRHVIGLIENGSPPFNDIDLILISHYHHDHFDPASLYLCLMNNPGAKLISCPQVIDSLEIVTGDDFQNISSRVRSVYPEEDEAQLIFINDIQIKILRLYHRGDPAVQNLGFILIAGNKTIFHNGDGTLNPLRENYESSTLFTDSVDIAMIDFLTLADNDGILLVNHFVRPENVIAMHFNPLNPSLEENYLPVIRAAFRDVIHFQEPLQSRVFE